MVFLKSRLKMAIFEKERMVALKEDTHLRLTLRLWKKFPIGFLGEMQKKVTS
jgi:hypothetical protein